MRVQNSFILGALRSKRNLKKKKNVSVICFQKTKMGSPYLSVNTARMEMLLGSWFPEQPIRGERPEVRERGTQRARDGWQLSRS